MPVYFTPNVQSVASRVGFQHARSSSVLIQIGSDPEDEIIISKDFISILIHTSEADRDTDQWESTEECQRRINKWKILM
jgi:hypothetical protein